MKACLAVLLCLWGLASCAPRAPSEGREKQPESQDLPEEEFNDFPDRLKDSLADIAEDCGGRKTDCFWDEAHDHIEFAACETKGGFSSIAECYEEAVWIFDRFMSKKKESETKKKPRRRRRRRRSRSSGGGSSPIPPAPAPIAESPVANFCSRTAGARTAILAKLSGVSDCRAVLPSQLAGITELVITLMPRPNAGGSCPGSSRASLRSGDFAGLTNLEKIWFGGSKSTGSGCINTVPEDIFSGLGSLTEIFWGQQNYLNSFPADTFRNLASLRKISLECHDENDPSILNLPSRVTVENGC